MTDQGVRKRVEEFKESLLNSDIGETYIPGLCSLFEDLIDRERNPLGLNTTKQNPADKTLKAPAADFFDSVEDATLVKITRSRTGGGSEYSLVKTPGELAALVLGLPPQARIETLDCSNLNWKAATTVYVKDKDGEVTKGSY